MKIIVKVKANAKENKVQKIDESNFVVFVKEPPKQGKANAAIIKLLAEYFDTSSIYIEILSGYTAKTKVIKINN